MRKTWDWASSRIVFAFVILLLALNVFVLISSVDDLPLPANIGSLASVRQGAIVLAEYYEEEATDLDLSSNQAVRDALAKFKFELEHSVNRTEIANAISTYGRQVQDVISREAEEVDRRAILELIKSDSEVIGYTGTAMVVVKPEGDAIDIEDEQNVLSEDLEERIRKEALARNMHSAVQVEISKSTASLLTTRSITGQLTSLRKEVETLQSQLQSTMQAGGFAPLSGRGTILRASVRPGADTSGALGYDVRDLINELFAAGARGIQIGGQRLIATSSVRSVGSTLLVNHRPVPTNPVVMKVLGDPEVLESSLDLLINAPYFGMDVAMNAESLITLQAYTR